jgi:hypothetical protein
MEVRVLFVMGALRPAAAAGRWAKKRGRWQGGRRRRGKKVGGVGKSWEGSSAAAALRKERGERKGE